MADNSLVVQQYLPVLHHRLFATYYKNNVITVREFNTWAAAIYILAEDIVDYNNPTAALQTIKQNLQHGHLYDGNMTIYYTWDIPSDFYQQLEHKVKNMLRFNTDKLIKINLTPLSVLNLLDIAPTFLIWYYTCQNFNNYAYGTLAVFITKVKNYYNSSLATFKIKYNTITDDTCTFVFKHRFIARVVWETMLQEMPRISHPVDKISRPIDKLRFPSILDNSILNNPHNRSRGMIGGHYVHNR